MWGIGIERCEQVVREEVRRVRGVRGHEADLEQEGMLGALEAIKKYDSGRGMRDEVWVRLVVRSRVLDVARRIGRRFGYEYSIGGDEDVADEAEMANIVDDNFEQNFFIRDTFYSVVNKLSERQRIVIYMWVAGYTREDIMRSNNISSSCVSKIITQFKAAFKKEWVAGQDY